MYVENVVPCVQVFLFVLSPALVDAHTTIVLPGLCFSIGYILTLEKCLFRPVLVVNFKFVTILSHPAFKAAQD